MHATCVCGFEAMQLYVMKGIETFVSKYQYDLNVWVKLHVKNIIIVYYNCTGICIVMQLFMASASCMLF